MSGTGLYDNLEKYHLPSPEAVFSIDFFDTNPKCGAMCISCVVRVPPACALCWPCVSLVRAIHHAHRNGAGRPFFMLARELYPGRFEPTRTHYFLRLLAEKGLLRRLYTQNIDTLETVAGVPADSLVEAHGSFAAARCRACSRSHSREWMEAAIFSSDGGRGWWWRAGGWRTLSSASSVSLLRSRRSRCCGDSNLSDTRLWWNRETVHHLLWGGVPTCLVCVSRDCVLGCMPLCVALYLCLCMNACVCVRVFVCVFVCVRGCAGL